MPFSEVLTAWVGTKRGKKDLFTLPQTMKIFLRISSRAFPTFADGKRLGSPEAGGV
jgi:hypothetical protein